jgi:hypothetical protein
VIWICNEREMRPGVRYGMGYFGMVLTRPISVLSFEK